MIVSNHIFYNEQSFILDIYLKIQVLFDELFSQKCQLL